MSPRLSTLLGAGFVELGLFAKFVSLMFDMPLFVLEMKPRLLVLLDSLLAVVDIDSAVFTPFLSSHQIYNRLKSTKLALFASDLPYLRFG